MARFLIGSLMVMGTVSLVRADAAEVWPEFPARNSTVEIPAQEWPFKPGPRRVAILLRFPTGSISGVNERTGIMLTLHNWGGTDCVGTANPEVLAERLNVVAICVNYLQSGPQASIHDPEPYDFGYLQALDALRALWFVWQGLRKESKPFDDRRVFATGGSGGGNVALMANKLAPRTFAGIIDICGMKKLSPDIAFHLPGGSDLNARWNRDPSHPYYLSPANQELRDLGHREHLAVMRKLNTSSKVIVVHGMDDRTCPFADAQEMVEQMRQAGIDVEPHFIGRSQLDGQIFTGTGHALGDRTRIVLHVAGKYLTDAPEVTTALRRREATDFERRDEQVRYPTTGGQFLISYREGFPVGRFEAAENE